MKKQTPAFPIVAIGASAGGLEAFEEFFKALPSDNGMAIVIIAHLSPNHTSLLPELLQKHTSLKVHQAKDLTTVEPGTVYVIPPNKNLTISNGVLQLIETPPDRRTNLPIDSFFRSLALDRKNGAICIILSGTGTDGTLGLKAIKGELGMAMAQSEESAQHSGMPRSAINTDLVDYVLKPSEMPAQLIRYTKHITETSAQEKDFPEDRLADAMQTICIILLRRTGHDFSLYKKNTIFRRIERRMHVHQMKRIEDYVRHISENENEIDTLFKQILIGVTNFFRDTEAFDILRQEILPALIAAMPEEEPLRVWVPSCSTGEEAYSIAILIHECMEELKTHRSVQIFATDIDPTAIDTARIGLYPPAISEDVNPQRLKRYFVKEDGTHRIKQVIREMIIFALQDLAKDPPFTKLNLISCRNLLIYLEGELQKRILPIFHYSLKTKGILFLGSSETIGQFSNLFTFKNKKWKIFERKASVAKTTPLLGVPFPAPVLQSDYSEPSLVGKTVEKSNAYQMVLTILQQSEMAPCVIINTDGDILYIHGRTGLYLEPAEGNISTNITKMARPGLANELTAAIRKVNQDNRELTRTGLKIRTNETLLHFDLTVRPILDQAALRGMLMVIFQETDSPKIEKNTIAKRTVSGKDVAELEQELRSTKENLQSNIEEIETSNEELKSANEELQSTNEELQSTNEELETSKEELQSLNEESITINVELQSRIDDLSKANDDMKNLLDSTQIATIFLDTDIKIRRFTPGIKNIIPLTITDIGRPIAHFASNLELENLDQKAREVLDTLAIIEDEVKSKDYRFYLMRILPYRTVNNVIDGVVLTFNDTTERVNTVKSLQESKNFLTSVGKIANLGSWRWDLITNETEWSEQLYRIYGRNIALGAPDMETYLEIYHPDDRETLQNAINDAIQQDQPYSVTYRIYRYNDNELRWLHSEGKIQKDETGKPIGFIGIAQDITMQRLTEIKYIKKIKNHENEIKKLKNALKEYK